MHLAFIMDGNRRWAKQRNLPTIEGHRQGSEKLVEVCQWCADLNVKTVTVYALSTENYQTRNPVEIQGLLRLASFFNQKYLQKLKDSNYEVSILGRRDNLPKKVLSEIEKTEIETRGENDHLKLQICFNYGARDEIVRSVNQVLAQKPNKEKNLTVKDLSTNLDSDLEPDLIIRTGGYQRISNFLLWQAAYSEFFFCNTLWPDFSLEELKTAIQKVNTEKRNFGK